MKLNKVMALALSGLMAVSMLAGCSNGTPNGEENNEGQVVVDDVASVMNTAQGKIKFETSPEQSALLTAAMGEAKYANANVTTIGLAGTTNPVYNYLQKNMLGKDGLTTGSPKFTPVKGESNSVTLLYVYPAKNITDDYALIEIAKNLVNTQLSTELKNVVAIGNDKFNATYTGEVSLAKLTKSDGDGANTKEAYYVLVTVTQNVGDTAIAA